ncbi:hypothetical protein KJ855_04795 [Patescibacteria group bacterium]|nr:hypothetical protein [Patescibacteria group bacterium]
MCSNQRNKQYHIFNQPHTKEDYSEQIKRIFTKTADNIQQLKKQFHQMYLKSLHKFASQFSNHNVTGDFVYNSNNSHHIYYSNDQDNCYHMLRSIGNKDCSDCIGAAGELMYETTAPGIDSYCVKFSAHNASGNNNFYEYCLFVGTSKNMLGCVGPTKKEYCILNKQYTQAEYEELLPKIRQHMNDMPYTDKLGKIYKYGEFFPPKMSPFAYNDCVAQEFYPLSKEEIIKKGYIWQEPADRNITPTIMGSDLPQSISEVNESILKEIIGCKHQGNCNHPCTLCYRIQPQELAIHIKTGMPLPDTCPNCAYYERIKYRNPLQTFSRPCQCAGTHSDNKVWSNSREHFHKNAHCPNQFATSYSPQREEIIYCEQCYQTEVE